MLVPDTHIVYFEIRNLGNIVHALVTRFLQIPRNLLVLDSVVAKFCTSFLDIEVIFEVFGGTLISILFDVLIQM